jgi:hypothetical protein
MLIALFNPYYKIRPLKEFRSSDLKIQEKEKLDLSMVFYSPEIEELKKAAKPSAKIKIYHPDNIINANQSYSFYCYNTYGQPKNQENTSFFSSLEELKVEAYVSDQYNGKSFYIFTSGNQNFEKF